jgi:hypothetical protein
MLVDVHQEVKHDMHQYKAYELGFGTKRPRAARMCSNLCAADGQVGGLAGHIAGT